MKREFLLISIIFIVVSMMASNNYPISAQNDVEENFKLTLITQNNINAIKIGNFIKSALRPLGIDVQIKNKFFLQFENDMYHENVSEEWDLAISAFGLGGDIPEFGWAYQSNRSGIADFGCFTYRLCNSEWKNWQVLDTGINQTSDVDELLQRLDKEFDLNKRMDLTDQFSELFMNKLLYDYPLLYLPKYEAVWNGFQGYNPGEDPNNGLLFYYDYLLSAIYQGAHWEYNPEKRKNYSDNTTLRVLVSPATGNFDRFQTCCTGDIVRIDPISSKLVLTGPDRKFHPDLAIQYEKSDWVVNENLTIPGGKNKFWIRDDAYWRRNTPQGSEVISGGPYPVTAEDFAFTIRLLHSFGQYRDFSYTLDKVENSITIYNTIPKINYFGIFDRLFPMPSFYLNQSLTYLFNSSITGTPWELLDSGILPMLTLEWFDFNKNPIAAGPFELAEFEKGKIARYTNRDDYWFPNEWDSPNQDFLLHDPGKEEAVFFTYNATLANATQKPTTLKIQNYVIYGTTEEFDNPSIYQAFEAGEIDLVNTLTEFETLGFQKLIDYIENSEFTVITVDRNRGADLLIFNLLNPNLKKFNIRRAIAHAIDKEAMNALFDGIYLPQDSPVWRIHKEWYKDTWKIHYNYPEARDLMRKENYMALDSNEFPIYHPAIPIQTITIKTAGFERFFLTVGIGLLVLSIRKRQRFSI